jgi:glycosyltransferase involved in cell wall biosynthesis
VQNPDLLVFSHLRWDYVWQRPQQIVSRLARDRRVWFVEEPEPSPDGQTRFVIRSHGPVTVVRRQLPRGPYTFGGASDDAYERVLRDLRGSGPVTAWLYTPLAAALAARFHPDRQVYDVMDDLAAFKDAPPAMTGAHQACLAAADVVFTGGPSLHRSVLRHRHLDVHLFRSGVEADHYAAGRGPARGDRPVAGYVGVLDERVDFALVAGLAAALPDWDIHLVGPVNPKIDGVPLPHAGNLVYRGYTPYARLPEVMAGFDVAIMPFARNSATRSISPTKTLEYFAAGLPVVSTSIRDVVDDYADVVHLADDVDAFAAACRRAAATPAPAVRAAVERLLEQASWDAIAARMSDLMAPSVRVPSRAG